MHNKTGHIKSEIQMYDTIMLIWTTELVAAGHRVVNMLTVALTGEAGRLGTPKSVQSDAK